MIFARKMENNFLFGCSSINSAKRKNVHFDSCPCNMKLIALSYMIFTSKNSTTFGSFIDERLSRPNSRASTNHKEITLIHHYEYLWRR